MTKLLMPCEVDRVFCWPRGRALRLARAGRLPAVTLPDGTIRFDQTEIEGLVGKRPVDQARLRATEDGHA